MRLSADRGCNDGTLVMGWGSGTAELPYLVAPLDALKTQAQKDGTTITSSPNDNAQQGASAAQNAEIAIVHINSDAGEGYITVEGNAGDRKNLDPWHNGNDLVKAVANVNKKTIVVVHSVGPLILESWIENPNVVAVVWAGLPGTFYIKFCKKTISHFRRPGIWKRPCRHSLRRRISLR
jgi:beta-glucosidase